MENFEFIKKYALKYLSKYDSSKANLKRILKNKIGRLKIENKKKFLMYRFLDNLIIEFENKKIINDSEYSIRKISNFSSQGKSKIFIIGYLMQKGIDKNFIYESFEEFELNNENWELNSAKEFIRKKKININDKNQKEKNLAKMSRAGFNYNLCKKVLEL